MCVEHRHLWWMDSGKFVQVEWTLQEWQQLETQVKDSTWKLKKVLIAVLKIFD